MSMKGLLEPCNLASWYLSDKKEFVKFIISVSPDHTPQIVS